MKEHLVEPFAATIHASSGDIEPEGTVTERRISDLDKVYTDQKTLQRTIEGGDPLVYRVVAAPVPERPGEVPFSVTTIEPGSVGDEFYMTKGHAHLEPEGETYYALAGRGVLLMYNGQTIRTLELSPGVCGYIPPGWAHRTMNVGEEPFRFLATYPGGAGHDYSVVERSGMGARVVRDGSGYRVERRTAGR